MTQEFDPLSFFSSQEIKHEPSYMTFEAPALKVESVKYIIAETAGEDSGDQDSVSDTEKEETVIHVLDLPPLSNILPSEVLITILKFLKPGEETNFGSQDINKKDNQDLDEILKYKEVTADEYQSSITWLSSNGYGKLSKALCHIHFSPNFFQYLNKILSSKFAANDTVLKLASLRISENCGRTARPDFQRRILLKDFEKHISLYEPALTSDNLGLKTWGSSLILSEVIVKEHPNLILEPVLELGAGTGLCGITISMLGYKDVILTDLPEILPNLEKNVGLNGCEAQCDVLDWTDPSSFAKSRGDLKFNTIVVADPIYSSDHPTFVVNMMKQFLAESPEARILLQIPIRKTFEAERENLWHLLEKNNFSIKNERIIDGFDDFGAQKFIYKELRWR